MDSQELGISDQDSYQKSPDNPKANIVKKKKKKQKKNKVRQEQVENASDVVVKDEPNQQ